MNQEPKITSHFEDIIFQINKLVKSSDIPVLVAIDGRSGAGKSTVAKKIIQELGGTEINSDNFWVGGSNDIWDKRSPQEKADKAIDWMRLRTEVLEVLLSGNIAYWHSFDWDKGQGLSPEESISNPTKLIVLDGAYSTRPELQDLIDLSILVEVLDDIDRRNRLVNRENQDYMRDWHSRWDVAEDYYFGNIRQREKFDLIFQNN